MKLIKFKILFLPIVVVFLNSCGYVSDSKPDPVLSVESVSPELGANALECDISNDLNIVNEIFERDVSDSFDCMRSNLKLYSNLVRRKDPDFITKDELGKFIVIYHQLDEDDFVSKMDLFFDVSSVLMNEQGARLNVRNIDNIFDLLIAFNREAVVINRVLKEARKEKRKVNFRELSRDLNLSLERLADSFTPRVKKFWDPDVNGATIDLKGNLLSLFEGEAFEDLDIDEDILSSLLSLKTLFINGPRDILSTSELVNLLEIAPTVFTSAFNLAYATQEDFANSEVEYISYLQKHLDEVASNIYNHEGTVQITTQYDVEKIVKKFLESHDDLDFILKVSREVKNKLIDGKSAYTDEYSFEKVRAILTLVSMGFDSYRFYLENETFFTTTQSDAEEEQKTAPSSISDVVSKQDFLGTTNTLAASLRKKMAGKKVFPADAEFVSLFKFLNSEIEGFGFKEETVDAFVGLKMLFVGGKKDLINTWEIEELLTKLNSIGTILYDLTNIDFNEDPFGLITETLLIDIRELRANINREDTSRPIFWTKDLDIIVGDLTGDVDISKFIPVVETLNQKLLGGYKDNFTIRDILELTGMVERLVGKLYFSEVAYENLGKNVNQKTISLDLKEFPQGQLSVFPLEQQIVYLKEFNHNMTTFRYFRDDKGYSYYGEEIRRHVEGLREIVMMKWASDLLLPIYGIFDEQSKQYVLNIEDLEKVLFDFRPVLEEFNLWTTEIDKFGRNILLLADLFQQQSDGTLNANALEAAEYGSLVFMAVKGGQDIIDIMIEKGCENIAPEGEAEAVSTECYRDKYFKTIMFDMKLSKYLPKLYNYYLESDREEIIRFLQSVEKFAKSAATDEAGIVVGDSARIFGAMLNIESTLIRFDTNKDNILDMSEMDGGFPVYRNAVVLLADLKTSLKGKLDKAETEEEKEQILTDTSRSIYYFMLEKMRLPNQGERIKIGLIGHKPEDGFLAKRLNIGKLLQSILEFADQ